MFQRLILLSALFVLLAPFDHVEARADAAEQAYQQARTAYYDLKDDAARRKLRHHWRNVADRFLHVAASHPKSARAPDALFTAAELLQELSRISWLEEDLRDAVKTYEKLLAHHATHRLADDGALALAHIQLERLEDASAARKTLSTSLKVYGKGDRAPDLRRLLSSLPAEKVEKAGANAKVASKHDTRETPAKKTEHASSKPAEKTSATATKEKSPRGKVDEVKAVAAAKTAANADSEKELTASAKKAASASVKEKVAAASVKEKVAAASQKEVALAKIASPVAAKTVRADVESEDPADELEEDEDSAGGSALVDAIAAAARKSHPDEPITTPRPRVTGRATASRPRIVNVDDAENFDEPSAEEHPEVAEALTTTKPRTGLGNALVSAVTDLARGKTDEAPSAEEVAALKARFKGAAKAQAGEEITLAEQLGLKFRRVVIDAGHGGHDTGAIGKGGTREKDVSLAISRRLATILEDAGLDVVLTRDDDTYLKLEERTRLANNARGDLFISIHCNAAVNRKLRGVETYTLNLSSDRYAIRLAARENAMSEKSVSDLQFILADLATKANTEESTRLASEIHGSLVSSLKTKYRDVKDLGQKEALFYVLLGAKMPAILVETSFLSNPEEEKRLASPAYQERIAQAIAEGVQDFMGKRHRVAKVD